MVYVYRLILRHRKNRARMGAKQKTKTKHQLEAKHQPEGKRTKVRRAEELRALFDSAKSNTTQAKQSEHTENKTLTPTPTELTASRRPVADGSDLTKTGTANSSRVYQRPQEATSLRTVISSQPYSPARRMDAPVRPQAEDKEESDSNRWLGPLLLVAAIFMGFVGYWNIERSSALRAAKSAPAAVDSKRPVNSEDRSRVDFYRQQLGHRLNRQRVDVEVENVVRSPSLSATDAPRSDRAMMYGAPLMPEGYYKTSPRDRTTPVHPDHPDARIQYGLQEEEHRDQFQKLVDKAYAQEFISNARANGYDVTLDSEYNVIDVKRTTSGQSRIPGSIPGSDR